MATRAEIAQTYDYIDHIVRNNLGDFADLSCAFYDGNYQLTLDQAQRAKHRYILDGIGFRKGMRVLDIGCGWGPVLKAVQDAGGYALGLTLSPKQHSWCRRNGMEAELKDWKDMKVDQYGKFDAVVSVGAFEHFCSVDDYLNGKQDEVYTSFFRLCHRLLPAGGRLYLQTMTWGQNRPRYENISLKSPRESNEYIVALIGKFYPGSWPPSGKEQIVADALNFKLVSVNNGRLDYIHTMKQWGLRIRKMTLLNTVALLRLAPRYLWDREFRYMVESFRRAGNRTCFEREIMDHYRMVFEKI